MTVDSPDERYGEHPPTSQRRNTFRQSIYVALALPPAGVVLYGLTTSGAEALLVTSFSLAAYLGRLVAEDRKVRYLTCNAPRIVQAIRQTDQADHVRLVIPGTLEVDCRKTDERHPLASIQEREIHARLRDLSGQDKGPRPSG